MEAGETRPWEAIRQDFPTLTQQVHGHPLIYFDNAATSQKPKVVINTLSRFYEHDNSNVHRGLHELSNRATAAFEGARHRLASYLGAPPETIVFTRGTTESINLVARAWGDANVGKGDVILLTEMEHHSNLVPWQLLARRQGAILRFVPITPEGRLDLEKLEALLDGRVKIFAFAHISNTLGTINPVADLCSRARRIGAVTLVDAAQSAGHKPLDVRELGCDFLALSGHKMCGPTGAGVLYGRKELLESMEPFHGGGEMISSVALTQSEFKPPPHRFEAGTPAIAQAIGLGCAADYLDEIGRQRIFEHDQELALHACSLIEEIPGARISDRAIHVPEWSALCLGPFMRTMSSAWRINMASPCAAVITALSRFCASWAFPRQRAQASTFTILRRKSFAWRRFSEKSMPSSREYRRALPGNNPGSQQAAS